MPSLKKIKTADNSSKDTVFGFVRHIEQSSNIGNIPIAIYYLCLAFYYHLRFVARKDRFKISHDGLTITNINTCSFKDHTIFLNQCINSQSSKIIKWKFKINQTGGYRIYFGLVSKISQKSLISDFTNIQNCPNYAVSNDNGRFIDGTEYEGPPLNDYKYTTGDQITYTLNLKNQTFSCQINHASDIICFNYIECDKNIDYTLVLQLSKEGDSVSLLDFIISS